MKTSNTVKLKDSKTKIRTVDIDELNMTSGQFDRYDTVPNYAFINVLINPLFDSYKLNEVCRNIVDIIKGTRNMTSLQYDYNTVATAMMLNAVVAYYVHTMSAALQHTKLLAYNDDVVMRRLIIAKFGITNAQIDNLINNREEYESQVAHAKDLIKSRLVNVGHFEEMLERFIYDYRFDDQSQYTTKIAYTSQLIIHHDNDWLDAAMAAAFGQVILHINATAHPLTILDNHVNWFDTYNDTPAKWYSVLERLCAFTFNSAAYHAFRTDYMSAYGKEALWEMKSYSIKDYYSDSDSAVLMNLAMPPAFAGYNTINQEEQVYTLDTLAADGQGYTTIGDILGGNQITLYTKIDVSDFTNIRHTPCNDGFGYAAMDTSTPVNTVTDLTRENRILNIHKPSVAKDAEISLMCISQPVSVRMKMNAMNEVSIYYTISALTLTHVAFEWSTHFKDGLVAFSAAGDDRPLPFVENTAIPNSVANQRGVAEFSNVNNFLPIVRWIYKSGAYRFDVVQEQFDLYEITPASIADASRAIQVSYAQTTLKLADTRITTLAQVLDTIKS